MIDHERQIGTAFNYAWYVFQMARVNKEIVRKTTCGELLQTFENGRLDKPVVVRFALDKVTHAFESRIRTKPVQLRIDLGTHEIDPAYNSGYEVVRVGQL